MRSAKWIFIVAAGGFLGLSCLRHPPQATDEKVDTQLGLVQEEEAAVAEDSLAQLREQQMQDQKRHLERQVTEPIVTNPQSD